MEDFLSAAPRGKRQRVEGSLNFSDDEEEEDAPSKLPKSSTDNIVERELKAEYAKKKAKADDVRKVRLNKERSRCTGRELDDCSNGVPIVLLCRVTRRVRRFRLIRMWTTWKKKRGVLSWR